MKTFCLAVIAFSLAGCVSAQVAATVDFTRFYYETNLSSIAAAAPGSDLATSAVTGSNLIPLIQFTGVPVTVGLENLARLAGLNFILQPDLFTEVAGHSSAEPLLTIRWENLSARAALGRICAGHALKLVENPFTGVARIARVGEPKNFLPPGLLDLHTNQAELTPEKIIPVIQLADVPLDLACMNLIRQSGRSIEMASNLMEQVAQDIDTNAVVTFREKLFYPSYPHNSWFEIMPLVNIRWKNLTCEQAIVALCENYDLDMVTNTATGNLEITPPKIKHHRRLRHFRSLPAGS